MYIFTIQIDKVLFSVLIIITLITSYRITVYHHVYVADIELIRINKDTTTIKEDMGEIPKIFGYGSFEEDIFWRSVENSINSNMLIKYNQFSYEPGTQFIWTIHYSYNSTKKNKTRRYIFEADDKGRLSSKNH